MTNRLNDPQKKKSTDFILKDIFDPLKDQKSPSAPLIETPAEQEEKPVSFDVASYRSVKQQEERPVTSENRPVPEKADYSFAILAAGVVSALILLIGSFYFFEVSLGSELKSEWILKQKELQFVNERIQTQEQQAARLKQSIEGFARDKVSLGAIDQLLGGSRAGAGSGTHEILSVLSKLDVEGLWLEKIESVKGRIYIKGFALQVNSIEEYRDLLKRSRFFGSVSVANIQTIDTAKGRNLKTFEIRGTYVVS